MLAKEENTVAFLKERGLIKIGTPTVFIVARKLNYILAKKEEKNEPWYDAQRKAVKELNPSVKVTPFLRVMIKMVNAIVVYRCHKF